MPGILFDEIVFGPVRSRRFGISLGINLLPLNGKLCSFDCIYCECGLNADSKTAKNSFYTATEIEASLQSRFTALKAEGVVPDSITFAGNGEPTLHPEFESIIDRVMALRDAHFPQAKITVLSNATRLGSESVRRALLRIDRNVLKLDAGTQDVFKSINRPHGPVSLAKIVEQLKQFNGNLIIQTMLLKGTVEGKTVDNTTAEELAAWLGHIREIKPRLVMLYPIDRRPPYATLENVPKPEFDALARRVEEMGIEAEVFY